MFEMMSLHMVAGQQSLSPLTDGLINDNLTEVWPKYWCTINWVIRYS